MPISKHDKQALSQLFIDMGVPLIVAMQTVESWSGEEVELPKKAENLAKLLNISVEFATKIIKKLEVRDPYTLENIRGKIIQIVTPIIAQAYVDGGDAPAEDKLNNLTDLFDVLISFSDSLSPSEDDKQKPHDMAAMIEGCEPLLSAIHEHSFDLGAEDALKTIMDGLNGRVQTLAQTLNIDNAIHSGLMKAVVKIYVPCYKAVQDRDLSKEEAIDNIWKEYDERIALIQGLTSYVADKTGIETSKDEPTKEEKSKPESGKQDDKKPSDESDKNDESDNDEDDGDFNPMAFFGS